MRGTGEICGEFFPHRSRLAFAPRPALLRPGLRPPRAGCGGHLVSFVVRSPCRVGFSFRSVKTSLRSAPTRPWSLLCGLPCFVLASGERYGGGFTVFAPLYAPLACAAARASAPPSTARRTACGLGSPPRPSRGALVPRVECFACILKQNKKRIAQS